MKKLPKAVLLTSEDMRAATDSADHDGSRPVAVAEIAGGTVSEAGLSGNVIELTPKPAAGALAPGAPLTIPAAPVLDPQQAARRRSRAHVIVERHVTYAAFGGCIPLPVLNATGVMAIIIRMVSALSRHYGVPFERARARAIVLALMGGTTPAALAVGAASSILLVVPGTQLVGLAISSVTAATCTRDVGRVFIDLFEKGATLSEPPAAE
jgi:uncharacterized protein (DUF697 family)